MADINYHNWKHNQLKAILQREQDRAFALLDTNPLLSCLLLNTTPVQNDELITLRASYAALRKEHDLLRADFKNGEIERREAWAMCSELKVQLAETRIEAAEENAKLQKENWALRDEISALQETAAKEKDEAENAETIALRASRAALQDEYNSICTDLESAEQQTRELGATSLELKAHLSEARTRAISAASENETLQKDNRALRDEIRALQDADETPSDTLETVKDKYESLWETYESEGEKTPNLIVSPPKPVGIYDLPPTRPDSPLQDSTPGLDQLKPTPHLVGLPTSPSELSTSVSEPLESSLDRALRVDTPDTPRSESDVHVQPDRQDTPPDSESNSDTEATGAEESTAVVEKIPEEPIGWAAWVQPKKGKPGSFAW